MENWSILDLVEEDWSVSELEEIEEAMEKNDKIEIERERASMGLGKLSVAEMEKKRLEVLRLIAASGLYPPQEDRERQMGCKNKNILTDRVTTDLLCNQYASKTFLSSPEKEADVGQSSGEGSTEETLANPGPDK